jgi:hypothetical protein
VAISHPDIKANGSDVNQNSDFNSLLSSTCSSCEVQSDKSAYWTPQLYFAHANGKFEEVPNFGMTVYYVGKGVLRLFESAHTYSWHDQDEAEPLPTQSPSPRDLK